MRTEHSESYGTAYIYWALKVTLCEFKLKPSHETDSNAKPCRHHKNKTLNLMYLFIFISF